MESFDPIKIYFKEIRKIPPISEKEFVWLVKEIKKGNKNAKRRMIEGNLRLVISIAKHYYSSHIDFLDLIEEGNMGLIRAVEKFKPSKKTRFSTYATLWIKQSVRRAIQSKEKTIKVPYYVFRKIKGLLKTYETIRHKLGKQPTIEQLAEKLNISIDEMKSIIQDYEVTQNISSMEDDITDDESLTLKDVIQDKTAVTPEGNARTDSMKRQMKTILKTLPKNHRYVIEHRFGVNGKKILTLEELGKRLSLTRERIRQIEILAMNTIKKHIMGQKNFEM